MAVPTITSITPSTGHTGGQGLVEIRGTGFKQWVIPAPTGHHSAPAWPTVQVLFGGLPGYRVAVISDTRLYVEPPRSPLPVEKPRFGEGLVDITVNNLLPNGSPIAGESFTVPLGYRYQRENLADEPVYARLVRSVVREFRLQVIDNVSISTNSDYDLYSEDLTNVVDVASVPALVLFGPLLQPNTWYRKQGRYYAYNSGRGTYEADQLDAPDTDDLMFTFAGISDQKQEALSLQASMRMFFRRNKWIYFDRHPTDPTQGQVKYDLDLDSSGIGFNFPPDDKSNLKSFSGSFALRGFNHEALASFPDSDRVRRVHQVLAPGETPSTPTSTTPPATTKAIVTFVFPEGTGVIGNGTITVSVPDGTDLGHLTPTITHNGASVYPLSGVEQNFADSVTYTVTAEDGSTQDYVVDVTYDDAVVTPPDPTDPDDPTLPPILDPGANMQLGTNFWYLAGFSGEVPMVSTVNWAIAYGAGENGLANTNIWNLNWLAELAPYSALRFMDWTNTNWSAITDWSQRRLPTADNSEAYIDGDSTGPNPGIAYEWVIDLCNRLQKDLWLNIPARSTPDYWTQLATLVKAKLNPALRCYVEYSNETWNGSFGQFQYTIDQGVSLGLPAPTFAPETEPSVYYQGGAFTVYQSLRVFRAFRDVFSAAEMGTRVIRVFAYGGNLDIGKVALENIYQSAIYNPTNQSIDMLAVAPYIGSDLNGTSPTVQADFHAAIDLMISADPDATVTQAAEHQALFSIPYLGCYEGGQHLLNNSKQWTTNPVIYDEYRYMLSKWSEHFAVFMHYTHTGVWTDEAGKSSWGALDHTGQPVSEAHKYRALVDWKSANP